MYEMTRSAIFPLDLFENLKNPVSVPWLLLQVRKCALNLCNNFRAQFQNAILRI